VGNRKVSYLIIFNKLNYFYYHFNYTFLERKSLAFTISSWSSSTRSHPLDIYSKEKAYDGNVFDNIFEYAETDNEGLKYFNYTVNMRAAVGWLQAVTPTAVSYSSLSC